MCCGLENLSTSIDWAARVDVWSLAHALEYIYRLDHGARCEKSELPALVTGVRSVEISSIRVTPTLTDLARCTGCGMQVSQVDVSKGFELISSLYYNRRI